MTEDGLVLREMAVTLGGRSILHGIDFTLPPSSLVAIVGPNGAGKSSLLRAIAGLVSFRGTVTFSGHELSSLAVGERAPLVAYLPQAGTAHWPLPARDIVALGRFPHGAFDPARLTEADARAVDAAMAAADCSALADRPIAELSGGERARVALARVLAVEAPLILADEPTAALDPRHQIEIMAILRRTADTGALVLAVTHDLGLAVRFCDQIAVMDRGRLVTCASPEVALGASVIGGVFGVDAFRARHEGQPVLLPWSLAAPPPSP